LGPCVSQKRTCIAAALPKPSVQQRTAPATTERRGHTSESSGGAHQDTRHTGNSRTTGCTLHTNVWPELGPCTSQKRTCIAAALPTPSALVAALRAIVLKSFNNLNFTRPLHAHGMSAPERQFMPRTLPPSWYDPQVRAAAIILCPPQTAPWPPVAQTTMPGRCGDVNRTQEYETTCTRYERSARGVVTVGIIR
jgi:hypothetical protein